MRKTGRGFTIVELLVVVAIIGLLVTIAIISYTRVRSDTRDAQRSAKITIIAEALEKYYDKNGEYPSCAAMMSTPSTISSTTLTGIDPNALSVPNAASGTNSILCNDLIDGSSADVFAYVGDGSTDCTAGACIQWTLKYREESTGDIISISSHRGTPAPTDLVATTTSYSSASLTWSPVAGAINYSIQRDTNSAFTSATTIVTQPGTTYNSTDLSGGATYYFRVNATIRSASKWSNTAIATTSIPPPTGLAVTIYSETALNLSWSAPASLTPVTGYKIERKTTGDYSTIVSSTGNTNTTYSDTGLVSNTQYTYRISTVISSLGSSVTTNEVSKYSGNCYITQGATPTGYASILGGEQTGCADLGPVTSPYAGSSVNRYKIICNYSNDCATYGVGGDHTRVAQLSVNSGSTYANVGDNVICNDKIEGYYWGVICGNCGGVSVWGNIYYASCTPLVTTLRWVCRN